MRRSEVFHFRCIFVQGLGVTRASDSPVSCGQRRSCGDIFSVLVPKGMISDPARNQTLDAILPVRCVEYEEGDTPSTEYFIGNGSSHDRCVQQRLMRS